MKKKLLPLAMLAGLAGAAGMAQAAHLNSDGLGQALIYPYYSTLSGNHTNISLVNTTNETKAVKVRFLEGKNSREVLDFNLYLSAYDHWSAVVTQNAAGTHAVLKTWDTSCTVPVVTSEGIQFLTHGYADDGGGNSPVRTLEGYVEVIEMGVLGSEDAAGEITEAGTAIFGAAEAAKHGAKPADGSRATPADCDTLFDAWSITAGVNGEWLANSSANITVPTGGLYGYANVVNVEEGTTALYNAAAIDSFVDVVANPLAGDLHFKPGTVSPSLVNATAAASILNGTSVVSNTYAESIDAVSALFTRDTLSNDYVTDGDINAETDWVITFPTKRFYVTQTTVRAPFSRNFADTDARGEAWCEHIEITYYDREEGKVITVQGDVPPVFSPEEQIPVTNTRGLELCNEVNVLSFNGSNALGSAERGGEGLRRNFDLTNNFVDGWATVDFSVAYAAGEDPAYYHDRVVAAQGGDSVGFVGLPVVGFAVQKYVNGTLSDGNVLSNYTGVTEHKYTRATTAP